MASVGFSGARLVRGKWGLWLFTDPVRLPNPLASIAALPAGSGVVWRGGDPALARQVAALCKVRRLALTVAGDWRLAASLGAGVHLRGGRGRVLQGRPITASAHDAAELCRGRRRGALVFLSPAFPTASHPGAPAFGPWRWARLAGCRGAAALGGVTGANVRRLGSACRAVGAIDALATP